MNARIDESVITELTNASFTDEDVSLKIRNEIISELAEGSEALIKNRESVDELYLFYNKYLDKLNSCKMELEEINSIPLSELKRERIRKLMMDKEKLTMRISNIKNVLNSVGSKIISSQGA